MKCEWAWVFGLVAIASLSMLLGVPFGSNAGFFGIRSLPTANGGDNGCGFGCTLDLGFQFKGTYSCFALGAVDRWLMFKVPVTDQIR